MNDFKNFGIECKTDKVLTHGYDRFYNKELEEYRNMESIGILEIGIQNSESMKLWKKYFPKAFIYGINTNINYQDECSKIFKAEQSNLNDLKRIKSELENKIYFINDDGCHIPEHQLISFDYLFTNVLEDGGVYIIEDIEVSYWKTGNIYNYNTKYGFEHKSSIIEKFKLLVDYTNYNFLSDHDKYILEKKTDFLSSETKRKILSISFCENCIIIKKKKEEDYTYHSPYYYEEEVSNNYLDHVQVVIRKPYIDGIGNVLKGFITASGISNNVVIECNPTYMYGNYDTILDDQHIFNENKNYQFKKIEYLYTCHLLVLKEEGKYQTNLFNSDVSVGNNSLNNYYDFKKLIDLNYDPEKVCIQVKKRIWNTIDNIKFKDIVLNEVELLQQNILPHKAKDKTLAISVRTWKGAHEKNINRQYSFDIYVNEIISILDKHKNITNVIFSIDNHEYEESYIKFFESMNINYYILKKNEKLNDLQFSVIKMLLLSKCDYLIANRVSTFTELIFWFSKCKIKVHPLF